MKKLLLLSALAATMIMTTGCETGDQIKAALNDANQETSKPAVDKKAADATTTEAKAPEAAVI